jgi:hypothetical protein
MAKSRTFWFVLSSLLFVWISGGQSIGIMAEEALPWHRRKEPSSVDAVGLWCFWRRKSLMLIPFESMLQLLGVEKDTFRETGV